MVSKDTIHFIITITQIIATPLIIYFIINWHIESWENIGVKANDMPIESLCVMSILISVLIVSALNYIRPLSEYELLKRVLNKGKKVEVSIHKMDPFVAITGHNISDSSKFNCFLYSI